MAQRALGDNPMDPRFATDLPRRATRALDMRLQLCAVFLPQGGDDFLNRIARKSRLFSVAQYLPPPCQLGLQLFRKLRFRIRDLQEFARTGLYQRRALPPIKRRQLVLSRLDSAKELPNVVGQLPRHAPMPPGARRQAS